MWLKITCGVSDYNFEKKMTATGGEMEEMILPCDLWNVHFIGCFAFWVLCIHFDSSFEWPQISLGNYTIIKVAIIPLFDFPIR